jgi:hypothetical protein
MIATLRHAGAPEISALGYPAKDRTMCGAPLQWDGCPRRHPRAAASLALRTA